LPEKRQALYQRLVATTSGGPIVAPESSEAPMSAKLDLVVVFRGVGETDERGARARQTRDLRHGASGPTQQRVGGYEIDDVERGVTVWQGTAVGIPSILLGEEPCMTAMPGSRPLRPSALEIDLGAAAGNIRAVRQLVGPERKIFAVVKADGYGHGAAEMGAVFAAHGADALAVADLAEGVRLRQRGIRVPILVYPNSLPEAAPVAIAHDLIPTLVDLAGARAYAEAAAGPCDVFVKVDVGLERLGVPAEQAVKTVAAMLELPRLRLAGLCAHPHDGDDPAYAEWQLGRFTAVVDELEGRGIAVPIRLLAASPFVLKFPRTYLNAVDPGRMLYGITFPGETSPVPLRPTLRALTTRIISLKELTPREHFADLAPFPVTAPMRLGVIPMGSADGLLWLHAGRVLVRGHAAPIVASPSLEHTRIDLTGVPGAQVGDEVVIIGRQGALEITAAEVAGRHGLGLHHVATTVGPRVARVYRSENARESGRPVG
jgi:alanine racemase